MSLNEPAKIENFLISIDDRLWFASIIVSVFACPFVFFERFLHVWGEGRGKGGGPSCDVVLPLVILLA